VKDLNYVKIDLKLGGEHRKTVSSARQTEPKFAINHVVGFSGERHEAAAEIHFSLSLVASSFISKRKLFIGLESFVIRFWASTVSRRTVGRQTKLSERSLSTLAEPTADQPSDNKKLKNSKFYELKA
jgi:hypothetical protein